MFSLISLLRKCPTCGRAFMVVHTESCNTYNTHISASAPLTSGARSFFTVRGRYVLCTVGCLASSLAFPHCMQATDLPPPRCDSQKCLQTWAMVLWGAEEEPPPDPCLHPRPSLNPLILCSMTSNTTSGANLPILF